MSQKRQRAFALFAAILFLLGSVAFTGVVIWQVYQTNKQEKELTTVQENKTTLKGTKLQGFEPVADVKELKTVDLVVGDGTEAKEGATVTVNYTGALAKDGTIFESSLDSGQPVSFGLDQVIKGWGEGIPGMKVGGKRLLVIPADLAYGKQSPSADIPPNSDLVFEVELLAVQ